MIQGIVVFMSTQPPIPMPMKAEKRRPPHLLALISRGVNAARLLSVLAAFAFFSFAWIDPFLVDGSLFEIRAVRAVLVILSAIVFGLTWTQWGKRHFIFLGTLVGLITGIGVVLLTEMTGGPSSPYWTMLVLTFFGVTLILPQKPLHAAISYSAIAVFYVLWMKVMDVEVETGHWQVSLAGISLSIVVSVAGAAYLAEYRKREEEAREELLRVNAQLVQESQERERAEALVQRTQQLDAAGRLGAGLAHELNNLLTVISGSAESIQHNPAQTQVCAERILKSAKMGANLTNDLLLFARKRTLARTPLNITSLMKDVSDMVLRSHPRRVQIQLDGFQDPIWIEGDTQLLSQAMLNLCLNGIHSMDGKGALSLRAQESERSRVVIEIADQGCGMSEEVMEQAIEPFFTTRAPGKGSGLGLSMAYGTVRDHQGTLTLSSQEGMGTTVRLEFPILHPNTVETFKKLPQPIEPQTNSTSQKPLKEGLRIMLVDDDDEVRTVIGDILTAEGCIVIPIASGDEALQVYRTEKPSFDLIVLDRMMPGISGEETFLELRKHSPEVPILMYSGLAMDAENNVLKGQPSTTFLQKPFSQETLFSCITKLLVNHE